MKPAVTLRAMVAACALAACTTPPSGGRGDEGPKGRAAETPPGEAPAPSTTVATAASSASTGSAAMLTADAAVGQHVRVVVARADSDALSAVRTERLRAKAEGRVLVVYAGAGWCEPCRRFKHAIESGSLDATLSRITLLIFDADRDTERLAAAGYTFQFIPFVALPGADGHPSSTAQASEKGSEAWRALVPTVASWQTPAP